MRADRRPAELRFEPDVPDGPEIAELDAREAGGWSHGLLHNRVTRFGVIEGEIGGKPVMEQPRFEADFELGTTLRREVGIPYR